jgi:molybdopterin/thiamine biosynthesis adenylyltransferase
VTAPSILIVGMGGLGAALALALADAGVTSLGIADDDEVERTNLHRQILFRDEDVGRSKLDCAKRSLLALYPALRIETHATRLLPHNAVELVGAYDLVVEGSDNFATKFLTADACRIARRPVVHGASIRWRGTALAVAGDGSPCYRCLFEDLPEGDGPNCAEAGVIGPVVGLTGALQAELALALHARPAEVSGSLITVDGRAPAAEIVRRRRIRSRGGCTLCGPTPKIVTIDPGRYVAAEC